MGMTHKQTASIIALNALISTLISVVVVGVAVLLLREEPKALPGPQAGSPAVTQTAGVQALPTATPILHVVKSGDTLSGLALQYDVPAEDIVAANQIQNPNFLQVGAELIIPVGGVLQVTATITPMPTAPDTPIPFEPPSADLTATAAALAGATATTLPTPLPAGGEMQVTIAGVTGAGQVSQEGVILTNIGSGRAELQGWTLNDALGNVYTFPNVSLWPGGTVTVFTRTGQDGNPPSSLYWGKLQPIWSEGETASLKDAKGAVIATFTVAP